MTGAYFKLQNGVGANRFTIQAALQHEVNLFEVKVFQKLNDVMAKLEAGAEQIPQERRLLLESAIRAVRSRHDEQGFAHLTFICTHNSRRSQFAQVWATMAARRLGLTTISCASGGTEVTCCAPQTIDSLKRFGFAITSSGSGENPRYQLSFSEDAPPMELYSKRYDAPENPSRDWLALMCCAEANDACPVVAEAAARLPLYYDDPKKSDGTPDETATYDQRCLQIAQEMNFLMRGVLLDR